MNHTDIANIRLTSQQITGTKLKSPKDIVQWMGAMQAQDYTMAKWAIGIRLPGSTDIAIEDSLNKGEILRTHLLRPTWHLVSADDIFWILDLTAPHIKSSIKSRQKELELTDAILLKSNAIIVKALTDKTHLTREDLLNELSDAKIQTNNNRAYHILLWAELEGLICSGSKTGNTQTYSLLECYGPKNKPLQREEALAKLANRYFTSHCPATLQDFAWWSGLSVTDARRGLEMNMSVLLSEFIDSQTYWFPDSFIIPRRNDKSVFLLPAYDEFIISYKNRDATFNTENRKNSISSNGVFKPVIVIDGQVTGIWKRHINKDQVLLETALFRLHNKSELRSIDKASESLSHFLGKKIAVEFNHLG